MKNKIVLAISLLLVFGLTVVAFAYNNTAGSTKATMDCCCKDGACPMKNKDQAGKENASCCDKDDCCCKGDSCPMKAEDGKSDDKAHSSCCDKDHAAPKKDGEATQTASVDMKNVVVVSDGESCCKPGADCCKGGSCCKAKKDN